jgi:hypothetical protein
MKYLVMICRGHVPIVGHGSKPFRVNKDVAPFLLFFLPKGQRLNWETMTVIVRHFHLAFKGLDTEEIYDVLMEQLMRAIHKYDPGYTEKVKGVVEVIENELSQRRQFAVADVNRYVGIDSDRYLRLLCRRGFLESVKGGKEKKITGFVRGDVWSPPAEFFRSRAIGIAYYLQTWFRYYLQDWIGRRMSDSTTTSGGLERNISAPPRHRRIPQIRARLLWTIRTALPKTPSQIPPVSFHGHPVWVLTIHYLVASPMF